jgi:hypothetical protein
MSTERTLEEEWYKMLTEGEPVPHAHQAKAGCNNKPSTQEAPMKSNIKKLDTTGISEKMVSFFSDQNVEARARATKFVRRKSAITGLNFLKAVVLGFLENRVLR